MDRTLPAAVVELTPGDPGGIGPQVMLEAWSRSGDAGPCLAGDPRIWHRAADHLNLDVDAVSDACIDGVDSSVATLPAPGEATTDGARLAWSALDAAVDRVLAGHAAGLVTGPIAKQTMLAAGFPHPGHTEYLRERAGSDRVLMVMSAPGFVVGLHTVHIPLREVAERVAAAGIEHDAELLAGFLAEVGIAHPRLGICGVNPHAGEGGALGDEDARVATAVEALAARGVTAAGPLPGDTAFEAMAAGRYDAVLAMYHDQGLAPFKLRHFRDGVNVSVGLGFVRTSPDHGTAFDVAAGGGADAHSAVAALQLARRLIRRRETGRGTRTGDPL